jgi:hypothetical protein
MKYTDEQRRIVAYLDGLPPIGVLRDRQAKVNSLPAHAFGRLQVKSGDASQVAPVLGAPSGVDAEYS